MKRRKKTTNRGTLHLRTEYEAIARNDATHQRAIGKKARVEKKGSMYYVYIIK